MADLLIWWTTQEDVERTKLLTGYATTWPPYLRSEFRSREGRNGRGRLWVAPQFNRNQQANQGAAWDDEAPICKLASDAGGIVINREDWRHVAALPGFVTDFMMRLPSPDAPR